MIRARRDIGAEMEREGITLHVITEPSSARRSEFRRRGVPMTYAEAETFLRGSPPPPWRRVSRLRRFANFLRGLATHG